MNDLNLHEKLKGGLITTMKSVEKLSDISVGLVCSHIYNKKS
jgi:hypothetical protein